MIFLILVMIFSLHCLGLVFLDCIIYVRVYVFRYCKLNASVDVVALGHSQVGYFSVSHFRMYHPMNYEAKHTICFQHICTFY